ncbi:GNAT family N-acetyltransferase [Streptomyces sp. NPDC003077]|uniref:GNAT family N-acetyltransferase n=1 Tax=Streptomyces sp. NPDC003077 TaxID=3154443 RepID=UPI0033B0509D
MADDERERETDVDGKVLLHQVDEDTLEELLAVAVGDADPEDVMPPVPGPPGWTTERQDAFRSWHRARRPGLAGPLRESTFAIIHQGKVVGSGRLAFREGQEVLETGMWLARSQRGRGIGTRALRMLLHVAAKAGARSVVADTTARNKAALVALQRNGATLIAIQDSIDVHAELVPTELPPAPVSRAST